MREICTSGSEGGGGVSRSLPLSEDHDAPLEWRAPNNYPFTAPAVRPEDMYLRKA